MSSSAVWKSLAASRDSPATIKQVKIRTRRISVGAQLHKSVLELPPKVDYWLLLEVMSEYLRIGNFFIKARLNISPINYINYSHHHQSRFFPSGQQRRILYRCPFGVKSHFLTNAVISHFYCTSMHRTPRPPSVAPRRSESLRKLMEGRPRLEPLSPSLRDVPLGRVIDQVLKHLIDIVDILLQEENSSNYIAFMRRSEQMHEELEKRLFLVIDQKMEGLRQQMMLKGSGPTKIRKLDSNSHLKHERKKITQSILAHHRSSSASLFAHHRSFQALKTSPNLPDLPQDEDIPSVHQENDDKTIANSIEFHSISARISELQQIQSANLKEICINLQKKMSQNQRDIHGLTQKYVEFRLKFEEKLQTNLEALWNVVTDIKSDIKC